MRTIPEMVDKIRELYRTQMPPATDEQLAAAEHLFSAEFGIPMPDGYRTLIGLCNGIAFNGVMFYGTEDGETPKGGLRFGLRETHHRMIRGVGETETTLRFVGETGNQLFAFDIADGTWKEVDRVGWDLDEPEDVYGTFEELFEAQVETFVDW